MREGGRETEAAGGVEPWCSNDVAKRGIINAALPGPNAQATLPTITT